MKIGIDGRLWGVGHTGIGRYTEELVRNLQKIDNKNEYVVFCRRGDADAIPKKSGWSVVIADIPHYTLKEQLVLPGIFKKQNLDLLHTPHFNVPLFYNRPFIVTIHDILWHQLQGAGVTTLPAPLYLIKHVGYKAVVKNAVSRARKIIVPSKVVKSDLVKQFGVSSDKVVVTYEGASTVQLTDARAPINWNKYKIKEPYLLYVGSLYPHKNVEMLVRAIKHFNDLNHQSKLKLVIVCGRSVFWERFKKFVEKEGAQDFVKLVGRVSDEELAGLYKNAEAFVFPTLSEGFGLPGLEAMATGTPVICSDIPVLHEVYADAALYFDPKNEESIAEKIGEVLHFTASKRRSVIEKGRERAKMFSWRKMAEKTLAIYNSVK
ncbi:MAG: glycosyltransferase family 1 protein [bacterium]|nr:glycosyltransferase family 1 protein [bacterium]